MFGKATKRKFYIALKILKKPNKIRNKITHNIWHWMSWNTIGKDDFQLFFNKDKVSKELHPKINYSYDDDPCPGHRYIGEAIRHFFTRKCEQVTGDKGPTKISSDVHPPKDCNFSVITPKQHTFIAESLIYHTIPPALRLNK